MARLMGTDRKRMGLAVLAAALGYFVDAYDLILYNIVRVQSLRGIAVPESALLEAIRAAFPERYHAANEQAFALGRAAAEGGERP